MKKVLTKFFMMFVLAFTLTAVCPVPVISNCTTLTVHADETKPDEKGGSKEGTTVVKKVTNSTADIYTVIKGVCLGLLTVVLAVCGLILIVGTQKLKDLVKEHFYGIVIGCFVLFMAQEIATYISNVFG